MEPDLDFADVAQRTVTPAALAAIVATVRNRTPLLLQGPPGVGKTMVARRIATLVTLDEQAERWLAIEHAAWGITTLGGLGRPAHTVPFRAPHHTVSDMALVGQVRRAHAVTCNIPRDRRGGCTCADHTGQPSERISVAGEVTLARFGILFLDELIEFRRSVIEALPRRLRAMGTTAPIVVATAQPCPCGWHAVAGDKVCSCPASAIAAYAARIAVYRATLSIETTVDLGPVGLADLRSGPKAPSSAALRAQIAGAS